MNFDYIKDYRYKELKQYLVVYLLILVAAIGLRSSFTEQTTFSPAKILEILSLDILAGAMCVLVLILNEFWPYRAKVAIVYGRMPSETIFSDIQEGAIHFSEFDLQKAQNLYLEYAEFAPSEQSAKWNMLLRKSKESAQGSVIEAQRLQLMTRDVCLSTISLLIMSLIMFFALSLTKLNFQSSFEILVFPILYLLVMLLITRKAAQNRVNRLVALVIKDDMQRRES